MRDFIRNEFETGKNFFENGLNGDFSWSKIYPVAKYMRHELGYGDAKLRTEIIKYCKSQDKWFREVPNIDSIKRVVSTSKKPYVIDREVIITESEIGVLRKIKDFKMQKVALLGLFLAKRSGDENRLYIKDIPLLRAILGKNFTKQGVQTVFGFLYNDYGIMDVNYNFLFVDNASRPIFEVKTNEDVIKLISRYVVYCGGELGFCKVCGDEFVKGSNKQKYCLGHRREKELETKRRWKNKKVDK